MSVAESQAIFMTRFNLASSDGSSGEAVLTVVSTTTLGSADALAEAPASAPAESMSRTKTTAGTVDSFVLE
jgi:hypothetical protein